MIPPNIHSQDELKRIDSNSKQRCEEIIHGTMIGLTLGKALRVDTEGGGVGRRGVCLSYYYTHAVL